MRKLNFVTPEYLLAHGFVELEPGKTLDLVDVPFRSEDPDHFDRLFFEADMNRNMFIVILTENFESENGFDHQIFVQDDAGCGFVQIPERWVSLEVEHLEAIYFGINGTKPKDDPKKIARLKALQKMFEDCLAKTTTEMGPWLKRNTPTTTK